ncbi:unnamed protein product [Prunus armeniaca]
METQKAWAADIPRGMGYTSNQQHGNLMGVLHQPKGEHEFALYKLSDAHSFKKVTPFSLKFTSAIL